jgi:hypothetical protein
MGQLVLDDPCFARGSVDHAATADLRGKQTGTSQRDPLRPSSAKAGMAHIAKRYIDDRDLASLKRGASGRKKV